MAHSRQSAGGSRQYELEFCSLCLHYGNLHQTESIHVLIMCACVHEDDEVWRIVSIKKETIHISTLIWMCGKRKHLKTCVYRFYCEWTNHKCLKAFKQTDCIRVHLIGEFFVGFFFGVTKPSSSVTSGVWHVNYVWKYVCVPNNVEPTRNGVTLPFEYTERFLLQFLGSCLAHTLNGIWICTFKSTIFTLFFFFGNSFPYFAFANLYMVFWLMFHPKLNRYQFDLWQIVCTFPFNHRFLTDK